MYAGARVSFFLLVSHFLNKTRTHTCNNRVGGKTDGRTGVLHIYQKTCADDRYVQYEHCSDHISPLHFGGQIQKQP